MSGTYHHRLMFRKPNVINVGKTRHAPARRDNDQRTRITRRLAKVADMTGDKIEAFIAEIRARPSFASAASADPGWIEELRTIERGLDALYQDCRPEVIEIVDRIQGVVARKSLPMKGRLLEVGRLLAQARDLGRSVH